MDWSLPPAADNKPAYLRIGDRIQEAVADSSIAPGEKLPAVRSLAACLSLSPATILDGYTEGKRRGLIVSTRGLGYFACKDSADAEERRRPFRKRPDAKQDIIDLRSNVSPGPGSWQLVSGLAAILPGTEVQQRILGAALTYPTSTEPRIVREAGAAWALRCGLPTRADDVLVAAGGQHALAAALGAIRIAGRPLAVPAMTNSGVLAAARLLGIDVVAVREDERGLRPDHLDRVCRTASPFTVYCAPAGGNPIPTSMSSERRETLVQVLERNKLWTIEDHAAGPLPAAGTSTLAARLRERCVWLGSVSQPIGFGFRLAFVVVPRIVRDSVQEALRALSWTGTTPGSLLFSCVWREGMLDSILQARRKAMDERHRIVASVFDAADVVASVGIPYVWLRTPTNWRSSDFHQALLAVGISVAPSAQFAPEPRYGRRGARVSAAPHLSADAYHAALLRVREVAAKPSRFKLPARDGA